jgi:hypothetical protein
MGYDASGFSDTSQVLSTSKAENDLIEQDEEVFGK